ncbi:hypothetical protein HCN44_008672 [Aphidius gifuensis]|uniref:Outer dynein arm-docking complex subunit 4 n=2 Tax=Aphidius gifuensis TaxID=684658 RepID=A0A834XMI8_APHGI|nr:hypothetical protein HCN44_008672 [Aphidius gifuensis]
MNLSSGDAINQASDILKPTLQDNDFLQSFVRIDLDEKISEKKKKSLFMETMIKESKENLNKTKHDINDTSKNIKRNKNEKKDLRQRRIAKGTMEFELSEQKTRKGKQRKKNCSSRYEEVYTDKDRAAAVNMGSRDIIQSLKIKRRQDRNKMMQIPEEADPSSMLALGAREMRSGDLNIAINCINKALELSPNDKTALLSRSKCYLLLGEPQKALEDAESVLTEKVKDPNNPKAIYYKAEALYHLGDFELSLVYYHRGIKIRPEFDQFRLGIQKAKEAIQNILGNNGGSMKTAPLINIQKIKNLDDLKTHEQSDHQVKPKLEQSENVDDQKSAIITDKKNQSSLMKQKNNTLNFLGQLNVDKKYLQNLLKRSDIKAAHQVSADHITKYAKEGILFLNNRQEFWRQQRSSTASSSNPI